ncbi:MAG: glycoside hydrolase family 3 C-terminal domain-containing protein [Clostridia bacterium]|nr:glycoside hydrolase family 3 C-terminal domain-containing protein [Clostridia bacterium]
MEAYLDRQLPPEARARDLCARMTLEEKAGQVHQQLYGFNTVMREGDQLVLAEDFQAETRRLGGLGFLYGLFRADPWSGRTRQNGLYGQNAVRAYNLVQHYTIEHSRFGIPLVVTAEYSHGHQALDAYLLPVNLAVGCTFDPELYRKAASRCARQERSFGIRLSNASLLDILRDPRWGRSEECFGEDPCLSSRMAEALVQGMAAEGVGVVAKHFCAQGETTGGKNASPARIGERELREIHLPAAEAAVKAGAMGVMAAYNEIDGLPCHANEWLLKDVLRGEFGFEGFVMADGCAVDRLDAMTGSSLRSATLAMNSGVDVGMWDRAFSQVDEAVRQGLIPMERLDEAVRRVLIFKFASGLFDDPYLPEDAEPLVLTPEEAPESLQLARESAVLLKNEGCALPLSPGVCRRIALIGPQANDLYAQMGDYTPPLNRAACSTLADGLATCLPDAELLVTDGEDFDLAVSYAAQADAVILALGGSSSRFTRVVFDANGEAREADAAMDCGEGVDLSALRLSGAQEALFSAVRGIAGRLITVLICGRPYAIADIAAQTDALMVCFYPGPYGGQAIAEVLTGMTPPSGRLSASLPCSAAELPVFYNPKRSDRVRTYVDARSHAGALYAFGQGIGYHQPVYSDVRLLQEPGQAPAVSFTVRNPSEAPCAAVPLLFLTGLSGDITRRELELKAFTRIPLTPGETRTATLRLKPDDLAIWNRRMQRVIPDGPVRLTLKDGFECVWEAVCAGSAEAMA